MGYAKEVEYKMKRVSRKHNQRRHLLVKRNKRKVAERRRKQSLIMTDNNTG